MPNLNIILIFTGIFLFLWIRYRKNFRKRQPVLREKQTLIRGVQLRTPLYLDTPLACLLANRKKFGEDFKEKEPPSLPHSEGCQCQLVDYEARSREWFEKSKANPNEFETDLGKLSEQESRYYCFSLILNREAELKDDEKQIFTECLEGVKVSSDFKKTVAEHLSNPQKANQETPRSHHSKSSEELQ